MQNRSSRLITVAAVLMLASGCSGDSPTATSQIDGSASAPLSSAIKSDIATTAGNAIASDLESLIANEVSAVGSFALLAPSVRTSAVEDSAASPTPSPTAPAGQLNCIAGSQPGVILCVRQPGPGNRLQCTFSEEKKLYLCAKLPEPAPSDSSSTEPKPEPTPAPAPAVPDHPESCSYNAAALIYGCTKAGEGKSVVKSYQFLDASGSPMDRFVKGTTEAIHYLMKTDGVESRDNNRSATHSLRDATVSGFLGPNRIWNGFGASADTNSHKEDLSTRKYTGLSVDTLKAVTFVDERATHPYPLSGVAIRVVDYTVVSTGRQIETTTVHKRVVVTFNGTADVPISLGDYSCVLHLDTHKVDGCR
jgi:hypothetical protein